VVPPKTAIPAFQLTATPEYLNSGANAFIAYGYAGAHIALASRENKNIENNTLGI
jgi:hypothetical protein